MRTFMDDVQFADYSRAQRLRLIKHVAAMRTESRRQSDNESQHTPNWTALRRRLSGRITLGEGSVVLRETYVT